MAKGSGASLSKAKSGSDATQESCAIQPADLRVGSMLPLPDFLDPSFSPYTFNFSKYHSFLLEVGKDWMFQTAGIPSASPVCHKIVICEMTL